MPTVRKFSGLPFVLSLAVLPAAGAQEPEKAPTFYESLDVQVANVEVFVTDKSGQRVTGLTREDFQLSEDGKPVAISNFFAVAGEPPDAPVTMTPAPEAPPQAVDIGEQRLQLAIVVDNMNLLAPDRNRLLKSVRETVISRLRPDELALVAKYDGTSVDVVQNLTADKDLLRAALDEVQRSAPAGVAQAMDRRRLLQEIERADTLDGRRPDMAEIAAKEVYDGIHIYVERRATEIRAALGALTRFTDSLAGLPGRKALLYVGSGLSVRPGQSFFQAWQSKFASLNKAVGGAGFDSFETDLTSSFEEMAQHANGNRITLYTLGTTQELSGRSPESSLAVTWSPELEAAEVANLAASLNLLADATGGLSSVDAIEPGPLLARMCDDFSSYYSLGFVPRSRRDGQRHRIEVALRGHPGLVVRHRDGRRERLQQDRMSDRTLAALLFDSAENPLEVALDVAGVTKNDKGQIMVEVLVKFPLGRLVLLPQAKFHEGKVSVWVASRDQHGRSSPVQEIAVPIRVPNEQLLTALSQIAVYKMPLLLRPEEHRIAVTVRDELGNVESSVIAAFKPGQTAAAGH